jgi:restriction endonuclease S subunit
MKLSDIAKITSGINGRRNPEGSVYYLSARDFVSSHEIDTQIEPSLMPSPKLDRHFLEKGDVLILSKGHHGFTAHSYQGVKQPAVASSIFMVLKNIKPAVLPEYLVWFINLSTTQNELINYGRGSVLPAINKTILGDLMIDVPDIETQHKIVALDQLKKQETKIINHLDQLKTTQLELQLKSKTT